MRIQILISIFLLCGLGLLAADAKSKASSKSGSNSTVKKTSSSKSKKAASARARRSAPRQSAPTAERYREIQQALTDKGYGAGPVDGAWGAEWVASLKNFQADQKLTSDGKLGSLSLIALGLGPKRDAGTEFAGKPGSIE